jgi:glycosyltransferase involved in cell wall biosynthesis
MKIFQFIYSLEIGGAERFVVDLSNELAKSNEIKIFTLRDDTIENQGFYKFDINEKVAYCNLKISSGFKTKLIWKLYKIIREETPDIIHCHLNLINYFYLLSIIFKGKVKFVYTIHTMANAEIQSKLEFRIRQYIFNHLLFNPIAVSNETKSSYLSYYKNDKVRVIINGRKFNSKSSNYDEVVKEISELKSTPQSLVFCHIARFDIQKNQNMLISVFNKLSREGYDILLIIIGDGFEKAFKYKYEANSNIHFLGAKTNVTDYLYISDAFCLSSTVEGMPITLIEAYSCGCIPICTPVGGMKDIIENGINGFVSKSTSENDYLETIRNFIILRETISKDKIIEYFKQNLSIKQCAKLYQKLYEKE